MKFKFIGWCNEDGHDKVWGVIFLEKPENNNSWGSYARCVTFWGRRGKKLQTKQSIDNYDTHKLIQEKKRKGYEEVDVKKLNEVYPEFESDLEKTAFWAMLKL